MNKRLIAVINTLFLIIIILTLLYIVFQNFFSQDIKELNEQKEQCLDINNMASISYDVCYDAFTKKIYLEIIRTQDTYKINRINISFYDNYFKNININQIPSLDSTKRYQIAADKNPQTLKLNIDVQKDFSSPVCKPPRTINVKYCEAGSQKEDVEVNFKGSETKSKFSGYEEIDSTNKEGQDILSKELVGSEKIWETACQPDWQCTSWERCEDGVQKRDCTDKNECPVPLNRPDLTRICTGECQEKWSCEWSECKNGFSVPSCTDENNCGTKNSYPEKVRCKSKETTCNPEIQCNEWTECKVDYNFYDLIEGVEKINGIRSRVCKDTNNCVKPQYQTEKCSVSIDIYTKEFEKCGKTYVGIYNKLTEELIGRIEKGEINAKPYLNVYLAQDEFDESPYCDYCFNNKQDADETDVDCGGSCMPCSEKPPIPEKSIFKKLIEWLGELLN